MLVPLVDAIFECLLFDWKYRPDLRDDFDHLAYRLFHAMVLPNRLRIGLFQQYKLRHEINDCLDRTNWRNLLEFTQPLNGNDVATNPDYSPEEEIGVRRIANIAGCHGF